MIRITPIATILALIVLITGPAGCGRCESEPSPEKASTPARPSQPNVVFIVLDTVRADHTSLCGYSRPTTPNLDSLVKKNGASFTCDAVAPGSWTLPSHASFFTAADPTWHRAHAVITNIDDFSIQKGGSVRRLRKEFLKKDLPMLATKMAAKGYHTAALSANPVVSKRMGLVGEFEQSFVRKGWGKMFDRKFIRALKRFMGNVPRDKPLFLFLNIADAHQPWAQIPEGVGWVPPRPRYSYRKADPNGDWQRFFKGLMSEEQRAAFLRKIRDMYDYGVFRADRNLGWTMDFLRQDGWCDAGCRFVLVSDHGEFLGEHNLLHHGHYIWESMVRVPLVVWGTDKKVALPKTISATHVHHLVLDGELPAKLLPVTSAAWPHMRRCVHSGGKNFCSTFAGIWNGSEKLLFMDDKYFRIDLAADPREAILLPLEKHPRLQELRSFAKRVVDDRRDDEKLEPKVIEKLQALGYMD